MCVYLMGQSYLADFSRNVASSARVVFNHINVMTIRFNFHNLFYCLLCSLSGKWCCKYEDMKNINIKPVNTENDVNQNIFGLFFLQFPVGIYIYILLVEPTTYWRVLKTDVELSILGVICQHISDTGVYMRVCVSILVRHRPHKWSHPHCWSNL